MQDNVPIAITIWHRVSSGWDYCPVRKWGYSGGDWISNDNEIRCFISTEGNNILKTNPTVCPNRSNYVPRHKDKIIRCRSLIPSSYCCTLDNERLTEQSNWDFPEGILSSFHLDFKLNISMTMHQLRVVGQYYCRLFATNEWKWPEKSIDRVKPRPFAKWFRGQERNPVCKWHFIYTKLSALFKMTW